MTDLLAFLRARYDEAERVAKRVEPNQAPTELRAMVTREGSPPFLIIDSARVLAEVDAKRRILDLHAGPHECPEWDRPLGETCTGYYGDEGCPTLRLSALSYAGHPDYRSEWAVAK